MVPVMVRYFASLREVLGASEPMTMADGDTVATLRDALIAKGAAHARCLSRERAVRCAVNQVIVDETAPLVADADIAFFPPVTGG